MPQRRSTQKSTLSGAFLHIRSGSRAELCEHGLADLVHVADDAVGAVVEDCRLGIGVHGDDHVCIREARDVVDRARHTERQQQLRLDHGAGLPDDELERQHAAVEHRARAGKLAAEALGQAKRGRAFILDAMLEQIPAPREELSEYAPRIITIKIPVDKIRDVIGTGGKVIRGIQEETGASIEVHEDGNVFIASVDTGGEAARKMVEDIVKVPEVGEEYEGEVVNIQSFGAFVKLTPNKDGLLHISRVANGRVGAVEDVLSEGDTVKVKVIEVDEKTGKISLDRLDKPDAPEGSSKPRNDKGHGNDRRDRDRKRDNRKPRRRD